MNNINGFKAYEGYKVSTHAKANETKTKTAANLSESAAKYLDELKKKYSNTDFIIDDYSTDEEAQDLLKTGKGEYNCVITPETLEKMAADEDERTKFEGIIEDAMGNLDKINESLSDEEAEKIDTLGISVDGDGKVSYYAIIKESLKEDESVKAAKEKAAEAKTEEAQKAKKEEFKERILKASSVEELIEMIKANSDKKNADRVEFGSDDSALKIDRVEFGSTPEQIIEQYIPTEAPAEKTPFDYKA